MRMNSFVTMNPEHLYGINLRDSGSVRKYTQRLMNDKQEYYRYLLTKMGFREALANAASMVYPMVEKWIGGYE